MNGQKNYYFINAVTSVLAGFLYVINPYVPIIAAFIICVMATIISLGFQDVEFEEQEKNAKKVHISSFGKTVNYLIDLKDTFLFIIKSNRLRSLILYTGIVWGILCLASTYRTSILEDVGASAQWIAIVSAIVGVACGIGAKAQLQFHKMFKNKSLSIIILVSSIVIWIMGIVGNSNLSLNIIIASIIGINILLKLGQGIYGVLTSRYLGNFAKDEMLPKIYSIASISRNVFRMIIGFLGSFLLEVTSTSNSAIISGIIFVIISVSIISYMKTRLGLKPEEYKKSDIKFK